MMIVSSLEVNVGNLKKQFELRRKKTYLKSVTQNYLRRSKSL
jgi:hypothetical protein